MEAVQKQKQDSTEVVKRETIIAELVEKHPEIVPILLDYGVHCVGCHISHFETIEQGLMGHVGLDSEQVDNVLAHLNFLINKIKAEESKS